jgi:hypothetical protein
MIVDEVYGHPNFARAPLAGYVAAVTLDRRHATAADAIMALPRYLVTDGARDGGGRSLDPTGPL